MGFSQLICGRSVVDKRQEKGLDLALEVLDMFKGRTFKVKGKNINAKAVDDDETIRFIQEELPEYYQYETRVVAYVTRKKACHVRIDIEGWLGIRSELRRYSPLDIKLVIVTE